MPCCCCPSSCCLLRTRRRLLGCHRHPGGGCSSLQAWWRCRKTQLCWHFHNVKLPWTISFQRTMILTETLYVALWFCISAAAACSAVSLSATIFSCRCCTPHTAHLGTVGGVDGRNNFPGCCKSLGARVSCCCRAPLFPFPPTCGFTRNISPTWLQEKSWTLFPGLHSILITVVL